MSDYQPTMKLRFVKRRTSGLANVVSVFYGGQPFGLVLQQWWDRPVFIDTSKWTAEDWLVKGVQKITVEGEWRDVETDDAEAT